jgi:hypothetical protein
MEQKTFHKQSGKFLSVIAENMPEIPAEIMQGWIQNPKALQKVLKESLMPLEKEEDFLNDLGTYSVSECNETKNLLDHKKDFKSYFSDNYKNWNLAQSQQALKASNLNIKEMKPGKNGNYSKIYNSFNRPLDEMAVTENRIIQILFSKDEESKKIRKLLDFNNFWTHFLVKANEEFFVVSVLLDSDGLNLNVGRFNDVSVWGGGGRYHFVAAV